MSQTTKPKRAGNGRYWYRFYFGECPVCGRCKSYKERVYGPKPKDVKDRIKYLSDSQTYDNCLR